MIVVVKIDVLTRRPWARYLGRIGLRLLGLDLI